MKICVMCGKNPATIKCSICGSAVCEADVYHMEEEEEGEMCPICASERNTLRTSRALDITRGIREAPIGLLR